MRITGPICIMVSKEPMSASIHCVRIRLICTINLILSHLIIFSIGTIDFAPLPVDLLLESVYRASFCNFFFFFLSTSQSFFFLCAVHEYVDGIKDPECVVECFCVPRI